MDVTTFNCVNILDTSMPENWPDEDHPAYWLAQLRKEDWRQLLLAHLQPVRIPLATKKQTLAQAALDRFEFTVCPSLDAAWQAWMELLGHAPGVIIQFRHSETDWTRGVPEFVRPDQGEPLGFVNIAGRLVCKPIVDVQPDRWQDFIYLATDTRCPSCEGAGRVDRQRCRACGGRGEIGG